jgi:diphthine-ammonia ligase
LTLSTPLFSHRLNIIKSSIIITDPEPYAVAYLRIEEAELVEKPGWVRPGVADLTRILGLSSVEGEDSGTNGREGLDEQGIEMLEELRGQVSKSEESTIRFPTDEGTEAIESRVTRLALAEGDAVRSSKKKRWFAASTDGVSHENESVGDELRTCFEAISSKYIPYPFCRPSPPRTMCT